MLDYCHVALLGNLKQLRKFRIWNPYKTSQAVNFYVCFEKHFPKSVSNSTSTVTKIQTESEEEA